MNCNPRGAYRVRSARAMVPPNDAMRPTLLTENIATNVETMEFCLDDLAVTQDSSSTGRRLFQNEDLARRLHACRLLRLSLFEGRLSIHLPRVPQTGMELTFYVHFLMNLAAELKLVARV